MIARKGSKPKSIATRKDGKPKKYPITRICGNPDCGKSFTETKIRYSPVCHTCAKNYHSDLKKQKGYAYQHWLAKQKEYAKRLLKHDNHPPKQPKQRSKIATRVQPSKQLKLYTHSCKGSSKSHLNKYKHWAKLVTAVDTTKTSGYAFSGEFLAVGAEHKVPVGSVIVDVCGDSITAFKAEADRFRMIAQANTKSMSGLIETVATQL